MADGESPLSRVSCTISRCRAEATVLVVLDRSASYCAHLHHAWTGQLETAYCAAHATQCPDGVGIDKYGARWTLAPLKGERHHG